MAHGPGARSLAHLQVTAKGAQLEQHAAPEYELTSTTPNRVFIHPQPPTLDLPIP